MRVMGGELEMKREKGVLWSKEANAAGDMKPSFSSLSRVDGIKIYPLGIHQKEDVDKCAYIKVVGGEY